MFLFFFFNDTATTEIYTLSLHDALPISGTAKQMPAAWTNKATACKEWPMMKDALALQRDSRSEEHTSELQSRLHLVCRLLLEKKNQDATRSLRVRPGRGARADDFAPPRH